MRTTRVEQLLESIADVKPHLRGWLHLGILPLTLAGGAVLVALSPDAVTRAGSTIFVLSAILLFGVSAAYHRGTWSPTTWRVLRRLDHCNIFVLIAGSCTAYALLLLDGRDRTTMLIIVWASAVLGVGARFVWPDAPRWLSPPIYVACGWGAVLFLPGLLDGASRLGGAGVPTLVLLGAGGALYVAGGAVYGLQRPNPWPRWFGFHEVFHSLTVVAFASHYIGISLATYALR
ncbi:MULTISPECIES: PAQR family membrane homeostasis protein TrhA [unclassified Nocardioides]|uniref:PAQR family membrane homeostasis protein TrhA n=1 Tax=unclassified Nocardioides TaxID=2615069 RepID=UPI0009F14386|nr:MULTISPECIES: hemolysin III family protein [unclassified Nocardioides]GAW51633.1 Hly-III family protein [Nocardioides sp. PD653-B2]GAW56808.1 Hly-III family protein [Nocardioides sp. PD653]